VIRIDQRLGGERQRRLTSAPPRERAAATLLELRLREVAVAAPPLEMADRAVDVGDRWRPADGVRFRLERAELGLDVLRADQLAPGPRIPPASASARRRVVGSIELGARSSSAVAFAQSPIDRGRPPCAPRDPPCRRPLSVSAPTSALSPSAADRSSALRARRAPATRRRASRRRTLIRMFAHAVA
jgi:hypothetical protein